MPRRFNLRQQERGALNRAGDEVREERYEHGEIEQAAPRVQLAAIDVDRVTHRLERVERDADRQEDAKCRLVHDEPERRQDAGDVLDEEVEVLEEPEHAEVRDHAQPQEVPAMPRPGLHPARGAVVDDGRGGDEDQKPRMDVAVEEVAADKEQHVLAPLRQGPVERHEGDEERQEVQAVEDH